MRSVNEACAELVATIKAAGFDSVSIDPDHVNPPSAVWVTPRGIHDITLGGSAELTVWLYLIAPDVETAHAMRLLDDGLDGLLDLGLTFADDDPPIDLSAAVLLPHTTTPLPAYRLAVDLEL